MHTPPASSRSSFVAVNNKHSTASSTPLKSNTDHYPDFSSRQSLHDPLFDELAKAVFVDVPNFIDLYCAPSTDSDPRGQKYFSRIATDAFARARGCGFYENDRWTHWPAVPSQTNVLGWFAEHLNPFLAMLGADKRDPNDSSLAQPSINTVSQGPAISTPTRLFCDSHGQQPEGGQCSRSPDLLVSGLSSTTLTTHPHHWRNVRVVGELKQSDDLSNRAGTIIQLAEYVRQIFYAQPFRHYVHSFTICGDHMRAWQFDRSGGIASHAFSINEEPLLFLQAVIFYSTATAEDIGFDRTIVTTVRTPNHQWDSRPPATYDPTTIPVTELHTVAGGPAIEVHIPEDDRTVHLLLDAEPLFKTSAIISRGSSLWCARDSNLLPGDSPLYILKQQWRAQERQHEGELLMAARGLPGIAQHFWHGEVCDIATRIRKGVVDEEVSKTVGEVSTAAENAVNVSEVDGTALSGTDATSMPPPPPPPAVPARNNSRKRSSEAANLGNTWQYYKEQQRFGKAIEIDDVC